MSTTVHKDARKYLSDVKKLYLELTYRRDELTAELYFQNSELPLKKVEIANMRRDCLKIRSQFEAESSSLLNEREELIESLRKTSPSLVDQAGRLNELEFELTRYKRIEQFCSMDALIEMNLKEQDWLNVRVCYLDLQAAARETSSNPDSDKRLAEFASILQRLWAARLLSVLELECANGLEKLGWPFEVPRDVGSHKHEIQKIRVLLDALSCVLPSVPPREGAGSRHGFVSTAPLVNYLFDAFQLRFRYHFYGDKKTNDSWKPEWFFTQILKWAQLHSTFFQTIVQPILSDSAAAESVVDGYADFLRLLVCLARQKLADCLRDDETDDSGERQQRFTHLVDETILFEMELAACCGYDEAEELHCVDVLSEEQGVLERWLAVERECHVEKADRLVSAANAWLPRYETATGELDHAKVPECADDFVLLLQLITERYRLLKSVVARAKFLQLQLDLLDDFRLRLIQISRNLDSPWSSPYAQLMNAFWYVARALTEWDDLPFFVQLQGVRKEISATNIHTSGGGKANVSREVMKGKRLDGAFEQMSQLFMHGWHQMKKQLLKSLVEWDLKSALQPYKNEKWYCMEGGPPPTNILGSFCPFLLELRERVSALETDLGDEGFQSLLTSLVKSVVGLLMAEMVDDASFNSHGAAQMYYDVTVALVPLVNSYKHVAGQQATELDADMATLVESLRILSLPVPTTVLLRDAIRKTAGDLTTALAQDFDVYTLDRVEIEALLRKRVDLDGKI